MAEHCTINCLEVAKALRTSPYKVSMAIENGQLPIGFVDTTGKRRRTIIIKGRWEAWKNGQDIGRQDTC